MSGIQATTVNAIDRIKRKDKQYRKSIQDNQDRVRFLAGQLAHGGDIEHAIMSAISSMPDEVKEEMKEFLQEQRERLKALSVTNVESGRDVDVFVHALEALKTDVVSNASAGDEYDELLSSKLQSSRQQLRSTQLDDMQQEPMVKQVLEAMGEKPEYQDEDEELEVVNNHNGGDGGLKCPISFTWLQDPVRNKMCGHVYSRVAIEDHIRKAGQRRASCPVAACGNRQITLDQLEPDKAIEMQVRARRRREEREQQERLSQMAGIDEDSEEET